MRLRSTAHRVRAPMKTQLARCAVIVAGFMSAAAVFAQLARPAATAPSAVPGKVAILIKGEATLYLNGKKIGDVKDYQPVQFPAKVSVGDLITLRAKSPFSYRAFRVAFIHDDGKVDDFEDVRVLGDVPAEKVDARAVAAAPKAANGKADPKFEPNWQQMGITTKVHPLGLPERGKWCTFGLVVHLDPADHRGSPPAPAPATEPTPPSIFDDAPTSRGPAPATRPTPPSIFDEPPARK